VYVSLQIWKWWSIFSKLGMTFNLYNTPVPCTTIHNDREMDFEPKWRHQTVRPVARCDGPNGLC